jgi:hypothetical protein
MNNGLWIMLQSGGAGLAGRPKAWALRCSYRFGGRKAFTKGQIAAPTVAPIAAPATPTITARYPTPAITGRMALF